MSSKYGKANIKSSEPDYITNILVTKYLRDERDSDKTFKFILVVFFSNDSSLELYRLYSDFYHLHCELETTFPYQSGQISGKKSMLPTFPSKKSGLFRTVNADEMRTKMNHYVTELIALEEIISKSRVVLNFFKINSVYDKHLQRDRNRNATLHPMQPTCLTYDEYVCIADFSPSEKSKLTMKKRDIVNVLVREGDWWFCECEGKSGWAPSTFLATLGNSTLSVDQCDEMLKPITDEFNKKYRAISNFEGGEGQHSCQPGDIFLVLERDSDGWWLAIKLSQEYGEFGDLASPSHMEEAWIPASYLESLDDVLMDSEKPDNPQFYSVTYNYESKRSDEITLNKGSIVEVQTKYNDGWWYVKYAGNSGFFPAYHLELPLEISVTNFNDGMQPPAYCEVTENSRRRNVAASNTVFKKVLGFNTSTKSKSRTRRQTKNTTCREPPPRKVTLNQIDSIQSDEFSTKNVKIPSISEDNSVATTTDQDYCDDDAFSDNASVAKSHQIAAYQHLKENLHLVNPAPPNTECPILEPSDASTEAIQTVREAGLKKAGLKRNDSRKNITNLVKTLEKTKPVNSDSSILSIYDDDATPTTPTTTTNYNYNYNNNNNNNNNNNMLSLQMAKINELQTAVNDLDTKMNKMEEMLKTILTKVNTL